MKPVGTALAVWYLACTGDPGEFYPWTNRDCYCEWELRVQYSKNKDLSPVVSSLKDHNIIQFSSKPK